MKTFKLHLIRHGMTAGNLQGLYIGSGTDLPLCDESVFLPNTLFTSFLAEAFCECAIALSITSFTSATVTE